MRKINCLHVSIRSRCTLKKQLRKAKRYKRIYVQPIVSRVRDELKVREIRFDIENFPDDHKH